MRFFFLGLTCLGVFLAIPACANDEPAGATSEAALNDDDSCTARLRFLQKDAYKEGAGRSSELWPPHTTTTLDITCASGEGTRAFNANHGTKPDAKDADGKTILVEATMPEEVVTAKAPWRDMQKLVASYGGCECAPDAFLSLDQVNAGAFEIVNEVASLFTCAEPTAALLDAAKAKDVEAVKRILAGCSVRSDATAADLEKAVTGIEAAVKSTLGGKHVCNNDAALQADLFMRFRDTGEAPACDPHDARRCSSPKLFFRPAKELE